MNDNPALEFWELVGERLQLTELQIGEVFVVERPGHDPQYTRLVARDGEDLICVAAPRSELGDEYKVLVLER